MNKGKPSFQFQKSSEPSMYSDADRTKGFGNRARLVGREFDTTALHDKTIYMPLKLDFSHSKQTNEKNVSLVVRTKAFRFIVSVRNEKQFPELLTAC